MMNSIPTSIKNIDLVEKRRNQLILAAINPFAKEGYHRSTLKELADASGLSYGNIYDYIGSKEDIFLLIHEFIRVLMETLYAGRIIWCCYCTGIALAAFEEALRYSKGTGGFWKAHL